MKQDFEDNGLCARCGNVRPARRMKFCSKRCSDAAKDERRKDKLNWAEMDEARMGPLYFKTADALQEYYAEQEVKPTRSHSLAEAEAESKRMPQRKGPTAAQMREQGFAGYHMNRSGIGPRTE
jgi:hypothetical protein